MSILVVKHLNLVAFYKNNEDKIFPEGNNMLRIY